MLLIAIAVLIDEQIAGATWVTVAEVDALRGETKH